MPAKTSHGKGKKEKNREYKKQGVEGVGNCWGFYEITLRQARKKRNVMG